MSRTANQVQIRVVKPGTTRIHDEVIRGLTADEWEPGFILTLTNTGLAATLPTTIDSQISGPVKYIALEAFDGTANTYVALQELGADTVLEGQISTGAADADDIGKRGKLVQDASSGVYRVDISSASNASLEIVDVEPVFNPWGEDAEGNYNLVWFKFLPAVLEAAPAAPAS